jgi:CheY-like chemotaxis protein/HPt (histidine-containing phosphotransfer) domain-containing protein
MDWQLPGMNGSEATQRIHADPHISPKPKVIMVTAYGREDVIQSAESAGVDGFLTKPISPSTLLDTLLSTLGRERVIQPPRETQTEQPSNIAPSYMGARLLLAEDNEISGEFAKELLCNLGIEVTSVTNGAEAVNRVMQNAFDGVLMDVQMPELDGLEATRRIRALSQTANDRFSSMPIIAMTALAMTGDREKSLTAGMNDHITKPIDPERLIAVLTQWIEVPEERRRAAQTIDASQPDLDTELLALKSIDAAEGIRRIGNKPKAFRRQLQRFREHYADAARILQQQISEQGIEAGEDYCHALKGVCGNLGARALFGCVTELDDLLKQGKLPEQEQFATMARLLDDVIKETEGLTISAERSATSPLNTQAFVASLERLAILLERDLGSAETLLEKLASEVSGSDLEDAMGEITRKVDGFEIDEALSQISALLTRVEKMA